MIESVRERELEGTIPQQGTGGVYTAYAPETLDQYEEKKVLFFKADWCSTFLLLDARLKLERDRIPPDVVILEVNYDTAHDLRVTYDVTTQHSFVQIDASGEMVKKWNGSTTLDEIVSTVQ
ncbi:hypothetical protein COU15_03150 [Candidatus Kaiserbacteria bacterium CG10_big_fil_rev_8_21_14_0_10_45_20]|uniref:Thioredoxin domain-containing protein n=1 Tax=Candidatus Kaiserbacteria bacterium CG10_big_fil_rev_8_21_14_0_10_45_20 TaxID=1974607 RepID=A0A2H0UEY0_9BACT|nr:MAG: hypothetical protein COU15_03150 [Candidatus Kaiserbacteria bacterium CG10_big_fil_rev_8_21_14_0_10_45_20]